MTDVIFNFGSIMFPIGMWKICLNEKKSMG